VHLEDGLPSEAIGQANRHLAVEAAGPQQSGIEHVGTVGGSHHDHLVTILEPVHLDE